MMRTPRIALLLALSGVSSAALSAGTGLLKMTDDQMRKSGITLARVTTPSATDGAGDGLRLSGTAVFPAKATQVISAPSAGVVEAVLAEPMDKVAAGAPLMRLHSPQLLEWQRSYVQASVQVQLANSKLKRDENLFKEGIISESRLQETRSAQISSRVAEQEQRQALKIAGMGDKAIDALARTQSISPVLNIAVPSAGTVVERMAAPGQRVEAGTPLAKVARSGMLRVELQAARQQAAMIDVGDIVTVAGCDKPGRITAAGAQLESATQTMVMRAELPSAESCLRPNQYVEAVVKPRRVPAGMLAVPGAALVRFEGKDYVFVHEGGGFRPVAVTVGANGSESAMVQGDLKPGAEVAARGASTLKGMWLGLGSEGK